MGSWFEDVAPWFLLLVAAVGVLATLATGAYRWMTLTIIIWAFVFLWLHSRED
ncbi:MAG: hypothetical protein QOF51_2345 [Chloroflexota bacterium]|jgi:hypothetical protein|nr:hypothetical protein [Chloroflexota bacterium]